MIHAATRRVEGHDPGSLFELLWRHRCARETDPRDKVYALLGLLEKVGPKREDFTSGGYTKSLLLVDYHASVAEVYKSIVRATVDATKKLNVLCASQSGMTTEVTDVTTEDVMPSWVPNWSEEWIEQDPIWVPWPNKTSESIFKASGDLVAVVKFGDNSGIIQVKEVIVDTIREIWDDLPFLKY